ncbi:transmembrane protein 106A isoform X1 [Otolemur garnettii]|uniref:transmembrane protein 106A isoform X1 n=1 Tax=Otolemur garnettii TaxID=30611 RepID=UPI000C7E8B57|nr:transmembrane protein 106A isoform X1 [Otolemur garnettii]
MPRGKTIFFLSVTVNVLEMSKLSCQLQQHLPRVPSLTARQGTMLPTLPYGRGVLLRGWHRKLSVMDASWSSLSLELEKQLVALIPYGDQRLKPRHTKLFVFLAVLICLMTSSSVVFFLFPRSITVQPSGLNSSTVAFDEDDIHLNITNILNISNSNYYPIMVTQLTIEVLHLSFVVGEVSNSLHLHVGPLTSEQIFYAVANRILDENTYKICTWLKIKVHHVLLHIQGTLTCSYLSHSEQLVFQSYEYVDCRGNTSVPHPPVPHPP